jgi:glycosyltransferase involved in cell wall biosynthesis
VVRRRLAIVISHPIQYIAPLHRSLAYRGDLVVRVFFTWHAGDGPMFDRGFGQEVAWDVPLTDGYELERVANTAADPGTHHFFGLRNPALVERVLAWEPDVVIVYGWAWCSHLLVLRALYQRQIPVLFCGDSHLLDQNPRGVRWRVKRAVLRHIFRWPAGFLVVGSANQAYYEAFGVPTDRLHRCAHTIDARRFAEPVEKLEGEATRWRQELGIAHDAMVLLFAGKFEPKKQPLELMRLVAALPNPRIVLILVGNGPLRPQIEAFAATRPSRFRVLPFQNQSRMPVVYRLGDLFVLPSAFGETWGLAVNEALASGRPVLVSDRVGCAVDLVDRSCGDIFGAKGMTRLPDIVDELARNPCRVVAMRHAAQARAALFDTAAAERAIVDAIAAIAPISSLVKSGASLGMNVERHG